MDNRPFLDEADKAAVRKRLREAQQEVLFYGAVLDENVVILHIDDANQLITGETRGSAGSLSGTIVSCPRRLNAVLAGYKTIPEPGIQKGVLLSALQFCKTSYGQLEGSVLGRLEKLTQIELEGFLRDYLDQQYRIPIDAFRCLKDNSVAAAEQGFPENGFRVWPRTSKMISNMPSCLRRAFYSEEDGRGSDQQREARRVMMTTKLSWH